MKQKIVEYIKKNKAVSYAELEYFFKECGYDYEGEAASFQTLMTVLFSGKVGI